MTDGSVRLHRNNLAKPYHSHFFPPRPPISVAGGSNRASSRHTRNASCSRYSRSSKASVTASAEAYSSDAVYKRTLGTSIRVSAAKRSSNYAAELPEEASSANVAASDGPSDVDLRSEAANSSDEAPNVPSTGSVRIVETSCNPSTLRYGAGAATSGEGVYSHGSSRRTEVDNSPNYKRTSHVAREAAEGI